MSVPHAFRVLVVEDQWRKELRAIAAGSDADGRQSLLPAILSLFGLSVEYTAGQIPKGVHELCVAAPGYLNISAGFIGGDYPKKNLEMVDSVLRWRYDDNGKASLTVGSRMDNGSNPLRVQRDVTDKPVGFWVRLDGKYPPTSGAHSSPEFPFTEPIEVFVVTFWPLDRLEDLVGARDHHSRFWNLLILDNLIAEESVEHCDLAYESEGREWSAGGNIELFRYFRHPEIKTDKDIRWIPDLRTQVIVEASVYEGSFGGDISRKIWPWFEIRKSDFQDSRDSAVREYLPCFPVAFREIKWEEFKRTIWWVAERVQRWHSPPIDSLKDPDGLIERYSVTDHPVFLIGPPGVGKSFVARAIHEMSNRATGPFVGVNCAAIPNVGNFFESTVFGRERNATERESPAILGYIQQAEGGTLFLDEIHHLTPEAQAKLLTFVQDKTYRPLGAEAEFRADVRLIVATNKDRAKLVADGFRKDLLQRLSFYEIRFKPLSEYTEAEFVERCRTVFEDAKKERLGSDSRVTTAPEGGAASRDSLAIPGVEALEAKIRSVVEEANSLLPDQKTHVLALHCTLRGPGRGATVKRLGVGALGGGARPSSSTQSLADKMARVVGRGGGRPSRCVAARCAPGDVWPIRNPACREASDKRFGLQGDVPAVRGSGRSGQD